MKKIKYLFIMILSLVVLAGCSIEPSVTVNSDGTVFEQVKFTVENKDVVLSNNELNNYFTNAIAPYSKALSMRNYNYDVNTGEKTSNVTVYRKFSNLCEYIENTVFTQYIYKQMSCDETKEYIEIKNVTPHIDYCSDCSDWPALKNIDFKITLPVSAEENDADNVDKTTYTWTYDMYTPSSKNFYLKINKNSLKEQEKIDIKKKKSDLKFKKIIKIISVILGVSLILFLAYNYLLKKYKKNNIDY